MSLILYFAYFTSIGLLVNTYFYKKSNKFYGIVNLNIIGLFINFLFLAIANIFFPINYIAYVLGLLIILPLIKLVYENVDFSDLALKIDLKILFVITIQLFFLFWVSNLSFAKLSYEASYYIQKIRWAQQFPLIPGLGNLESHYGLDSSHYLQLAFLDKIPFIIRPLWNFSGYLLALGMLYFFVIPTYIIIAKSQLFRASDVMKLLFTPILIHYCFDMHPGLESDLPVFIFGSFLSIKLFKNIFENENNLGSIFICICLGFCSKMSFLPVAILTLLILLILYRENINDTIKEYKLDVLLIIIGLSLQIHRNILLTGYPFYPFEGVSVPVEWKMNKKDVKTLSNGISRSAKGVFGVEKNAVGIKLLIKNNLKKNFFLQRLRIETLYPLILTILGLLYIIINKRIFKRIILFALPALGQLGMWYFYAPDSRFASFAFWWLGAGFFGFTLFDLFPNIFNKLSPIIIILISFSFHTIDQIGSVKNLFIQNPSNYMPTTPSVYIFTTNSGLELLVPENGQKCDDSPIPCTRFPRENLSLREPGIIESGFYLK